MVRPPVAEGGVEPPFLHQLPAGGRPEGTSGDNQQKAPRDSQRGTRAYRAKVGFHRGTLGDRVGLEIEGGEGEMGGSGWGAIWLYLALLLIHRCCCCCCCSGAPGRGLPGTCRLVHQPGAAPVVAPSTNAPPCGPTSALPPFKSSKSNAKD